MNSADEEPVRPLKDVAVAAAGVVATCVPPTEKRPGALIDGGGRPADEGILARDEPALAKNAWALGSAPTSVIRHAILADKCVGEVMFVFGKGGRRAGARWGGGGEEGARGL